MTSRALRIGAVVGFAYVAAVVATTAFTSRDVRPLFDAIGPPPAYRWVKPPPDFQTGNVRPTSITIGPMGLTANDPPPGGASDDSQFVFNLPRNAIAPKGDAQLTVKIDPVDPATLGALPAKTFADGNAYKIAFAYAPGGETAPVTTPGNVLLTVPVPASAVYYSPDGKTWRAVKSQNANATSIGAEMPDAGYFVATSPDVVGTSGGSNGAGRLVLPIIVTVVIAAALVLTPVILRRRRAPQTRQSTRQQQRRRQQRRRRTR